MSEINPYRRPMLHATRKELADPSLLVDLWIDQFLDMGATDPAEMDIDQLYDWIALGGRLRRCRQEWLMEFGQKETLDSKLAQWGQQLKEWVPKAIRLAQPMGWLQEAENLAQACDDGKTEMELAKWAERLICDLDDADLIGWAARHARLPDDKLEAELAKCFIWLEDNSDRFFPAGVFIQAVGLTIRPDLDLFDLEMLPSAEKFVLLLDAMEEAESLFPYEKDPVLLSFEWPDLPAPLALAAQVQSSGLQRRRWHSPDNRFQALLVVDSTPGTSTHARIHVEWEKGPATELAGQTAWLAGCPAVIDAEGNVDFPFESLREADHQKQSFDFAVGQIGLRWTPRN